MDAPAALKQLAMRSLNGFLHDVLLEVRGGGRAGELGAMRCVEGHVLVSDIGAGTTRYRGWAKSGGAVAGNCPRNLSFARPSWLSSIKQMEECVSARGNVLT